MVPTTILLEPLLAFILIIALELELEFEPALAIALTFELVLELTITLVLVQPQASNKLRKKAEAITRGKPGGLEPKLLLPSILLVLDFKSSSPP